MKSLAFYDLVVLIELRAMTDYVMQVPGARAGCPAGLRPAYACERSVTNWLA